MAEWDPMSRADYADILDDLEVRWGTLHKSFTAPEMFDKFSGVPAHYMERAVREIFDSGLQGAPAASKVRALVLEYAGAAGVEIETAGPCEHLNWAIAHEHTPGAVCVDAECPLSSKISGTRLGICGNDNCRAERLFNPGELTTAGERGELEVTGKPAPL